MPAPANSSGQACGSGLRLTPCAKVARHGSASEAASGKAPSGAVVLAKDGGKPTCSLRLSSPRWNGQAWVPTRSDGMQPTTRLLASLLRRFGRIGGALTALKWRPSSAFDHSRALMHTNTRLVGLVGGCATLKARQRLSRLLSRPRSGAHGRVQPAGRSLTVRMHVA